MIGVSIDAYGTGSRSPSASRSCPLCLRTNQPMTREHIFARWLVQKVHGARLVPSGATPSTADPRIARVVAAVCAECNAGWMSGLEVSFRGLLFGRPRVGALQAPDRTVLSRWFTKTAVLLADAGGGTLVGATHRAQLKTGMPDGVEVFLGRRRRPPQRLDYAVAVMPGPNAGTSVRSVAILVDDLVGHVAAAGTLASRHGTRIWPLRSHLLRWETLPVIRPVDSS